MANTRNTRKKAMVSLNPSATSRLKRKLDKGSHSDSGHLYTSTEGKITDMEKIRRRRNEHGRGEQLTDGEMSTLSLIASLDDDTIERYKKSEPHWTPLVESMRDRLQTSFAKSVARYLLKEETQSEQATLDEQDAWELAQIMMKNGRPGFGQKFRQEGPSQSSMKR